MSLATTPEITSIRAIGTERGPVDDTGVDSINERDRSRLRVALPQSRPLTPEAFRVRHQAMLSILTAHALALPIFGIARGYEPLHVLTEASILGGITLLAACLTSMRARALAAATGLVTSSAILVHVSGGTIEAHFHFFVVLGLMTLYHDWTSYVVAFAYVVIHHGVIGVLDPQAVYNHAAAQGNPWGWAAIHGAFVLAAAMVQIFSWRAADIEHERMEALRLEVHDAQMRRQQALQLNDDVVQRLVVAKLAGEMGDAHRSQAALVLALERARRIMSDLIGDREAARLSPGDLVRDTPSEHEAIV